MHGQSPSVTARHHHQATVLSGGIGDRNPDRQHLGGVGVRRHDALVLMPEGTRDQGIRLHVLGQQALGRLDADVLDRIGVDFGTDEAFDRIQESRVSEKTEHFRRMMNRGVAVDPALRQRDFHPLEEGASGLADDGRQTRPERQAVVASGEAPLSPPTGG